MKPKRFYFRSTALFGTPLRCGAPAFVGFTVLISGLTANAGDILRGGGVSNSNSASAGTNNGGGTTPAATDAARANAQDALARTTRAIDAVRAMQNAARNAAINGADNAGTNPNNPSVTLPNVPNGLGIGGLHATTDPTKWTGANAPTQTLKDGNTEVTIKQTTQQALLGWQTFNVGKKTTLTFDQTAGGENASQWIAFNKISDPSGNPTQILGSIKATGQVYIINQNGIIFGGSSQVNVRGLTVSSLPINDNLVAQGLLNNRDAQFLFSGLIVPGGADGTPNFDPGPPPASGKYGDVTVQKGGILNSPAGSGGNGGRIMLVGPNVTNDGTISTESGQTILVSGMQVGIAAHDGGDPSLRGIDVWVGAVGGYAGTTTNNGLIQAFTGSVSMSGSHINQMGVIDSSTSVNLNGRIDINASYGAVANPNFDNASGPGAGGPLFFNQFTGVVTFGVNSVSQILPDYLSEKSTPGTALPERSRINVQGNVVHFDTGSTMLAPNAEVSIRAGVWPYKDAGDNRTIFDAAGVVEAGITEYYSGSDQRFLLQGGQIYVDDAALINVAGSTDVFVPLSQSILKVKLLGNELADSPLQRDSNLRGKELTVDIRNTGTFNGKFWVGTPLGDVAAYAGLIQRNAAQLTAAGGNVSLKAGGSIVLQKGSAIDVSGGYFQHEAGLVKTSYLMTDGRLVDIKNATPDQVYDGVYTGESNIVSDKWGVVDHFSTAILDGKYEAGYVEGAAGGKLTLSASSMAIDGELRGSTVRGPRQRSTPPAAGTLNIRFESEKIFTLPGTSFINYITTSPTPPAVVFAKNKTSTEAPAFSITNDVAQALPADRIGTVSLYSGLLGENGFGALELVNPDGSITVPANVALATAPMGSISLTAANISVLGSVTSPGGKLAFTTYNISPTLAAEDAILNPPGSLPFLTPDADRGHFTLVGGGKLSTAGLIVDDAETSSVDLLGSTTVSGGEISIKSYHLVLEGGADVDVSGGVYWDASGKINYGKGGAILVQAAKDPGYAGLIGGTIRLDSTLSGYSGSTGGTLSVQAGLIHVGGTPLENALNLTGNFFRSGGFTKYDLSGIGAASTETPPTGQFESYFPAVSIAAGTQITPLAQSWIATRDQTHGGELVLQKYTKEDGLRSPVSLSFTALGFDDPYTLDKLEVRGDILMGAGAQISTGPGASVSFKGGTVTVLGSVIAPGGRISLSGAGSFPFTSSQKSLIDQALPTVHVGSSARLSTAGVIELKPDIYGRRIGKVYDGGTISVSGNILAENGAILDVSGTSGILDLAPNSVANVVVTVTSGLNSIPFAQISVPTRVDSNGGLIDLTGSQMLLSDATLLGAAGGKTATGGALSVFSGNYYREGEARTSADSNLYVKQSGNVILNPGATMGVGLGLFDQGGAAYGDTGYFVIDRFAQGSFASLSLGGKYLNAASPVPYGGNVTFQGPININASGTLRLAAGGVIHADSTVNLSASYISVGQDFRAPQNANDVFASFTQDPGVPSPEYRFAATFGNGKLNLNAGMIDVGTLSMQNIGNANFTATGGDIRGNGTLNIAGDLVLNAAQVYPTTLGKFDIFAYDHAGGSGSVTILSSGSSDLPFSAGGSLGIYASTIRQSGVLRAPLGTIRLGWDGTDLDSTDADLDSPWNLIAGSTIATPITQQVVLSGNSVTSVSGKGINGGKDLLVPFGVSPDGLSWIDPTGANVTLNGLPEKAVFIKGNDVTMASGAVVDISGGGDLLASRWVSGNGGSVDLLGSASAAWGSGTSYKPGALVTFGGETYSARIANNGQTPGSNLYWSKIAQSFAILPGYNSKAAPYNPFNTGSNAGALSGDPGYVDSTLKVGDSITIEGGQGIPAGTYTLLPRRYALLDGAYLVTPIDERSGETLKLADGSVHVSGYSDNAFNQPLETSVVRSRFEIASAEVLKSRVTYNNYSANKFIPDAAKRLDVSTVQLIPADAGYAAFHGSATLELIGNLLTQSNGRGAIVDISSFADIRIIGENSSATGATEVALRSGILNSWGADSLLIGGLRKDGVGGSIVDVRTNKLTLDNSGELLSGPDIVLASTSNISITDDSALASAGTLESGADTLLISGDGTLVRVSTDANANMIRSEIHGVHDPLLTIGSNARVSGNSVILDSSYGSDLATNAVIEGQYLTLGSGQISIVFDGNTGALDGSLIVQHLVLAGTTFDKLQQSSSLTLQSYSSIDLYGSGVLGRPDMKLLTLKSGGVRGYRQGTGVEIHAKDVSMENPSNVAIPSDAAVNSGSLNIEAETVHLGAHQFSLSGYQNLSLNASQLIVFDSTGSFSTSGDLKTNAPVITGAKGAAFSINSAGAVTLDGSGTFPITSQALGASLTIQGASIAANSRILLPSGQLTLRAKDGSLSIGGNLSVAGSSQKFNDLTRYSSAGNVSLESLTGDVKITAGGFVSVAAETAGGDAGNLSIRAVQGAFVNEGSILGQAGNIGNLNPHLSVVGKAGNFLLDIGSFSDTGPGAFSNISTALDQGGFYASRNFRVRSGDVTIGNSNRSNVFSLAADQGSILVTGSIDASGIVGGSISLSAHDNLTLAAGSRLSVAAERFNSAGKGGAILLEAGTQRNEVANTGALLDLQSSSTIDLSVAEYVAGTYTDPASSAFRGKFSGTLHLRAPRTAGNNDLRIGSLGSAIIGASSVIAEGFKVYTPTNGVLNIAQRNLIHNDAKNFLGAAGVGNANEVAMRGKLLSGAPDATGLDKVLVIAPGVEIINRTGDLTLGLANNSLSGSSNVEALSSADWDLSDFRYGSRSAPGVLTMRAGGNLVFNNTLSDGFSPIAQGTAQVFADNGHSQMWLATLKTITGNLPVNTQSWSYRLTAGADTNGSNFQNVLTASELDLLQPSKGSVIVGEFYPTVPNSQSSGLTAGIGSLGQTADTIRISGSTTNRGNRFEVVRTGTGDITINAGRDVQLRNQFSTIYTAGVALPTPTTIFNTNDFVQPVLPTSANGQPSQAGTGNTLGIAQQIYPSTWSMAGGNISIGAQANIGHYTMLNSVLTVDSSRQMPNNWLYRRAYVNSETGLFANDGGLNSNLVATRVTDTATSTTWWIDFSNFFEGVGALGGGNVTLSAGNDVVNVDAVSPTNARMPGRKQNPDFGVVSGAPETLNLAPDSSKLLELGGGDVSVTAGRNINGGVYYVERGKGTLFAGGEITTNASRSPSLGILNNSAAYDSNTWLPTTLFVGKSNFDVAARGDVLLGPISNPFLLPQGINNKFWYKTYFSTFAPDAGATVTSYGGSVTHRMAVNLPGSVSSRSILDVWFGTQDVFAGSASAFNASNYQPWLRLSEMSLESFASVFGLTAPNLSSTAFSGDINLVGSWTLFPSATGNLELVASEGIIGLQDAGLGNLNGRDSRVWTASSINVSDASPLSLPSITTPIAYQAVAGRDRLTAVQSQINVLQNVNLALSETGSYKGLAGTAAIKNALHAEGLLHTGDLNPVRLYATGGDITGVTLFSPKQTRIMAGRDITDISFYLQNVTKENVSLVAAGRDIIPFNENGEVRTIAGDLALGNVVGDPSRNTVAGTSTSALAGDIQINGPGELEVLSGRKIDLGTGANFDDGTGVGITSIGNSRNPSLPFGGADIIAFSGLSGIGGFGVADGLANSTMLVDAFIAKYLPAGADATNSAYLDKIDWTGSFEELTDEQKAIVALENYYKVLRDAGRGAAEKGNYTAGDEAVLTMFGTNKPVGDILTRAREFRTVTGGAISLGAPGGGITMASDIFGNPLTPPGIVTEYGGSISTFTDGDVSIGQARIFTLRGGDITMWSSNGNIAAGTSPKTVVTAPPTRVVIDFTSADVQTDLGGLATGGGIGVLAAVEGVKAGDVDLIAPKGFVDAGDAGIRVTGNLNIAAQVVLNAGNISASGTTSGASGSAPSAPSLGTVVSASNSAAASTNTAVTDSKNDEPKPVVADDALSIITVEVIGYGGSSNSDDEEEKDKDKPAT